MTSTAIPIQTHRSVEFMMTEKEYHSLKETYKFLCFLVDPKCSPRVAKEYRDMARKCLKDFPNSKDYAMASETFYFFNPR